MSVVVSVFCVHEVKDLRGFAPWGGAHVSHPMPRLDPRQQARKHRHLIMMKKVVVDSKVIMRKEDSRGQLEFLKGGKVGGWVLGSDEQPVRSSFRGKRTTC